MRNLMLVKKAINQNALPDGVIFCVGDNSSLFCCDNDTNRLLRILYNDQQFSESEELAWSDLLQNVFQMQFLVSTGALFIATKSGSFLQYYLHNEIQELFQSAQNISTFAVSPDSRMTVMITNESTLLLMSLPDLEVIMQIDLTSEGINTAKGESETFSVSWLHDSTYFAVNYFDSKAGFRKIKFYDDTGALYSTTEDSNPLVNDILSWQPSGGLITAIGRPTLPKDSVMISLFELNGLKRADFFTLDGTGSHSVSEILWNSASDILALNMGTQVQLWTRNNYRWMLKLTLQDFDDINCKISWVAWDPELSNRLHIVYAGKKYIIYDFAFAYTLGHSGGSCISISVNGDIVYCTPFRDNCAPPPDCFFQVKLTALPVDVIVSSFWNGIACVLTNGTIAFYKNSKSNLDLVQVCNIPNWNECRSAYSWLWTNISTLCCTDGRTLTIFSMPKHNSLIDDLQSSSMKTSVEDLVIETRSPMPSASIYHMSELSEESDFILIQEIDGQVKLLNIKTLDSSLICKFPHLCSHVKYIFHKWTEGNDYTSTIVFGHDPLTRKLYAGWRNNSTDACKLSGECTSISTYQDNLLFTTVKGSLKIIGSQDVENILSSNSAILGLLSSPEGQYSRKSEKGSIIATCCLNQMYEPSLVLQIIPRGNLETIYPRPLVISSINLLLRNKSLRNFTKIMAAMRRHRIDYNILINELKKIEVEDPNMPLIQSLQDMVNQVKDSHSLVLLVTEMNENNYDCLTIIKDVLEDYMRKQSGGKVYEPYLAVMAKLGLYEDVLKSELITGDEALRDLTKSRIKFLSFYCDNPEILYESALGTYDLNLTAIVADCLNKDPKEYIPVLNDYRAMSTCKMHYTIDNSLRRYGSAMKSLINDESVQIDEIIKYISRHRLFPEALHYLSSLQISKEDVSGRNMQSVLDLIKDTQNEYGLYLQNHGKLREASIFYARSENYENAIECCMKSCNWEYAMELVRRKCRADISKEDFKTWCRKLVDALEERKEFEGAAHISEVYLEDTDYAVKYLISAQKWSLAASLCLKNSSLSQDKIDQLVKPKIIDAYLSMDENIKTTLKDVVHYEKRLDTVKLAKENKKEEDENDTFSDTDSISTGSGSFRTFSSSNSWKTHRSNKNRRKQERKVFSLKEGSPFEDLAITVHLWDIFNQINIKLKVEVSSLIEALWRFNLDDNATSLASSFETLLSESDKAVKVIWETLLPENHLLDSKFRLPPTGWSTVWDKLSFGYSSISASGLKK